jgi:hypothetical protein
MRNYIFIILSFIFSYNLSAQKNSGEIPLFLRGVCEWENLCLEVDNRAKISIFNELSYVSHFKIKSVEKKVIEHKTQDTTNIYFLDYDTLGLLKRELTKFRLLEQQYCFETNYFYSEKGFLLNVESFFCAIIHSVGKAEILPVKEVREYDSHSNLKEKKGYYFSTKNDKNPNYRQLYTYNKYGLIKQIDIYKGKKLVSTEMFEYNYYN